MSKDLLSRIIDAIHSSNDIAEVNEIVRQLTGIRNFFLTLKDTGDFLEEMESKKAGVTIKSGKEYGDFQTNEKLASDVCSILLERGVNPSIVIEPTSGMGNFILAALKTFKGIHRIIGVELQQGYVKSSKNLLAGEFSKSSFDKTDIEIVHDDIFTYDFNEVLSSNERELLIIGNPPWVTNSELAGKNLPKKSNFKKKNGLDAITGKANFDISEYIILHLLKRFKHYNGTLALLCKTQVARNIIEFLPATDLTASNFGMFTFDARKEFNASVDAGLFVMDLNGSDIDHRCKVYSLKEPGSIVRRFGWTKGKFVSDTEKYEKTRFIDGVSPLTWRSGIKHDCSKVMELNLSSDNILYNGLEEIVSIEQVLVYPLLKSSQLKGPVIKNTSRRIIVTQRKPGQNTNYIKEAFPLLWQYLMSHGELLDKRKSVIYKKNPPFSIFGVGDYSFAPYKIAISGLYKDSKFSLVVPIVNKPVMLDDSCYQLDLYSKKEALVLLALLNSKLVQDFLKSIIFIDAKRPYTKDVLMRIDLIKVAGNTQFEEINSYLKSNKLSNVDENDYEEFRENLMNLAETASISLKAHELSAELEHSGATQLSFFGSRADNIVDELNALDMFNMTPLQALNKLQELKKKAEG